jgi:hypothetical protein
MTNPKFVKWLSEATRKPAGIIPAELNTLGNLSRGMAEEDRAAVDAFISEARRGTGQQK